MREGCLRNRFEMGQIMAFWFWQRPCRARPVLWLWNECRKRSQQRLVKTGGRLVKHARYYWLLLAESHLTRRLFASMLRRILALPLPAG